MSAPNFVVRVLIGFVDVANSKVRAELSFYSHEWLDYIYLFRKV